MILPSQQRFVPGPFSGFDFGINILERLASPDLCHLTRDLSAPQYIYIYREREREGEMERFN